MPRKTQANNKTQPHDASVHKYIDSIEHKGRQEDARELLALMSEVTGEPARMWGSSIIGFGEYHYEYESGREGDHMLTGFAPRKANMVVYIMPGFKPYQKLLDKLGKYKTGRSCLYIKRLSDVDEAVLEKLINESVTYMRKTYKTW